MIGTSREHTVTDWNDEVRLVTHHTTKTVWRAAGQYQGQLVEVKGSSEAAVLSAWRDAARYRGS